MCWEMESCSAEVHHTVLLTWNKAKAFQCASNIIRNHYKIYSDRRKLTHGGKCIA